MSEPSPLPPPAPLTPEQEAARRRRNLWIALSIAAFMVLIFVVTLAQLRAGSLDH